MANAPVLPMLSDGLPPAPPLALDPYLDAGARCFARYGISRTTMPDIAREIGVSRTTVYRQVGNIDHLLWMLAAREAHRLIATLPGISKQLDGPHTLVKLMASIITQVREHPVVSKVLSDEPDVVAPLLTSDLNRILNEAVGISTPLLAAAMQGGMIANRNPEATANWLVRMAISLVMAPVPDDLEVFLKEILVPALTPDRSPNHSVHLNATNKNEMAGPSLHVVNIVDEVDLSHTAGH